MRKKQLKEIAERHGISVVYLFGSQAEIGKRYLEGERVMPDASSDLDVAVAFERPPEPDKALETYGFIYKELSILFDPFEIDLIFLHEHNALFKYEIIKGIRIYVKDEESADNIEMEIMRQAEDLSFKRKKFCEEIMEAIEDGYFEFEYSPSR
ncbi:MAG: nucleotidyltransferase domain-containing protein [Thermodesulfovibrionales bacterium]